MSHRSPTDMFGAPLPRVPYNPNLPLIRRLTPDNSLASQWEFERLDYEESVRTLSRYQCDRIPLISTSSAFVVKNNLLSCSARSLCRSGRHFLPMDTSVLIGFQVGKSSGLRLRRPVKQWEKWVVMFQMFTILQHVGWHIIERLKFGSIIVHMGDLS